MSVYKRALPLITLCLFMIPGSFLISRFFKSELIRDVGRERQRLESIVFRTYIREFERISILIQSVQQIQSRSEEELKDSLENFVQSYGKNGQIPYLIKSAAYTQNGSTSVVRGDSEAETSWDHYRDKSEYAELEHPLQGGQVLIKGNEKMRGSFLYYMQPGPEGLLLIFELDKEGIEEYYSKPALAEALKDYQLEWKTLDKNEFRDGVTALIKMEYPFNPLKIISGWNHNEEIKLMIPLPDTMDSRRPFIPGEKDGGDSLDMAIGRDSLKGKLGFFPRNLDSDPARDENNVLLIGAGGAPFYSYLEKRTALNWLMSQLILFGIALVFLLLITQLRKTKEIRIREKEFVASMTHELRTPITVIQSAADNLSRGIVSEEKVIRYGKMMKDQTKRLSNMIEEILIFSSLEGNKLKNSDPVEMDLSALIKEMEKDFTPLAEEKKIPLHWDYEGLPARLFGCPSEIRLILSNLVSNALNHAATEPDSSELRVTVRHYISGKLKITVDDSGPGIPSSEQKKIFDPFYRTAVSREQQTRGSGLGLFIAGKKTMLIGGNLKLESPYKKLNGEKCSGCRFILELPCKCIDISEGEK